MNASDIAVEVVYCFAPRKIQSWQLNIAIGSTVADVLDNPMIKKILANTQHYYGIWNKKVTSQTILKDGDRLEIYRQLIVDPKTARRERFKQQGAKAAGLFAKRRKGAKAGY